MNWNSGVFSEIRNSNSAQELCLGKAQTICTRANSIGSGEYVCDVQAGKTRCHAMVKTTDIKSRASNAKHNTLLKAMGA